MAYAEVQIPAMGEGIIEATIIRWLVQEGDPVLKDSPLAEIATDKVDTEVTAPCAGVLKKILRHEGDIPQVGELIALISLPGSSDEPLPETKQEFKAAPSFTLPPPDRLPEPSEAKLVADYEKSEGSGSSLDAHLSPFIRMAAREMGIEMAELARIRGTAAGNRISKKDFYNYLENKLLADKSTPPATPVTAVNPAPPAPSSTPFTGPHEKIKMDRMRQLIATHMLHSKNTAAHVTSFYEADLTNLVLWRNTHKEAFQKKYGEKLTFTPLFIQSLARVLKKFPIVNASVEGDTILLKRDINIGLATALPDGNLIVPVIKQADTLNLDGLAHQVNDLSMRAREGRLLPAEISGGSFTITNLGMFQSLTGTPIINQPESAILAIGAILRKPAVVMGPFGESIGIRDICILSLSYDHRIIDGAMGGMFLRELAKNLEESLPDMPL